MLLEFIDFTSNSTQNRSRLYLLIWFSERHYWMSGGKTIRPVKIE